MDGPDLFDKNDTLKPCSWSHPGEEEKANPDIGQANGPQYNPPLSLIFTVFRMYGNDQLNLWFI